MCPTDGERSRTRSPLCPPITTHCRRSSSRCNQKRPRPVLLHQRGLGTASQWRTRNHDHINPLSRSRSCAQTGARSLRNSTPLSTGTPVASACISRQMSRSSIRPGSRRLSTTRPARGGRPSFDSARKRGPTTVERQQRRSSFCTMKSSALSSLSAWPMPDLARAHTVSMCRAEAACRWV